MQDPLSISAKIARSITEILKTSAVTQGEHYAAN